MPIADWMAQSLWRTVTLKWGKWWGGV